MVSALLTTEVHLWEIELFTNITKLEQSINNCLLDNYRVRTFCKVHYMHYVNVYYYCFHLNHPVSHWTNGFICS